MSSLQAGIKSRTNSQIIGSSQQADLPHDVLPKILCHVEHAALQLVVWVPLDPGLPHRPVV